MTRDEVPAGGGEQRGYGSGSVGRHLVGGVLGFGLLGGGVALVAVVGLWALVGVPLGLVALRGCPTCWLIGLRQTLSRGRLERRCVDGGCTLVKAGEGAGA